MYVSLCMYFQFPETAPKDIFYWEFIVQYGAGLVLGIISIIYFPGVYRS